MQDEEQQLTAEDIAEWEQTESQVIEEFKEWARRSNERNKDLYKRIREERAFESGDQWGDSDKTNRGDGRAEMTINLCSVFVNAVVNPFNAKPFKIRAIARYENLNDEVSKLNSYLTAIQNDSSTHESNSLGFHDEVGVGLGFTYATIEDNNGERKIKYLHIEDQTMVITDPDSKGIALEQSDRIAVVDILPYGTAKEKFGDDVVKFGRPENAALTNFGDSWEIEKDHVAVITYFRRDGHNVEYFRLCGDRIVDYGVFEGLDYLPVFAFTGDRIWLDKKRTFSGIIRKIKSEQKTINYAQSQLIERLAKSPKGFFLTPVNAIEGFEEDYQNAEFGTSYVIRYNAIDSKSKVPIQPPSFIQPQVHTEDLQAAINSAINQMSVATGISPNGIVEQNLTDQKTATEVLLRTKSSQSNVSNYIAHAKETIRIAGNVLAHLCIMLYGLELPKGSYDIVVEEGCVSLTKMEEDREKLLALAQIIPPEMKGLVSSMLVSKLDIEGGQKLSQMIYNMLPSALRGGLPSMAEFQQLQLQMQELQAQSAQKDEEIKLLNDQLTQAQLRTKTDLIMEDKRFEHDVQMELLKNSQQEKINAQDVLLQAKREQAQNEQELNKTIIESREKLAEKVVDTVSSAQESPIQGMI